MANVGQITIRTEDYVLRSITKEDYTDDWLTILNKDDVKAGLNLNYKNLNKEQCLSILSGYNNKTNYLIGIFRQDDDALAGFYVVDLNLKNKTAIFSLAVNTESFRTVVWKTCDDFLDYFFDFRDVDKMSSRILVHNKRILYTLLVNGRFQLEGVLKKDCLLLSGQRADVMVWSSFKNSRGQRVDFTRQD